MVQRVVRLLRRVEGASVRRAPDHEIRAILAKLSPRERAIIQLRFGVGNAAALSDLQRLSPAAMRRLEARAFRKLRADAMRPQDEHVSTMRRLGAMGG